MTVEAIIDGILEREGGYSDHPADRGGPTKYGITAKTLGLWRHLGRHATRAEVQALTEAEAREIYAAEYVHPFRAVPMPLQVLVVDWGVTTSRVTVVRALQEALQRRGHYDGAIDGILGPQTRTGLGQAPIALIYADVLGRRMAFYEALAFDVQAREFLRTHPDTQLHFLRGWQARCRRFLVLES